MVDSKVCSRCHRDLSIDNFGVQARMRDGFNCYCRLCIRIMSKKTHRNRKLFLKKLEDY